MKIKKKKPLSGYDRQRIAYWENQWLHMRERLDNLEIENDMYRRKYNNINEELSQWVQKVNELGRKLKRDRSMLAFSLSLNLILIILVSIILGAA